MRARALKDAPQQIFVHQRVQIVLEGDIRGDDAVDAHPAPNCGGGQQRDQSPHAEAGLRVAADDVEEFVHDQADDHPAGDV